MAAADATQPSLLHSLLARARDGTDAAAAHELRRAIDRTAARLLPVAADAHVALSVIGAFNRHTVPPDCRTTPTAELAHSYVEGNATSYALRFDGMRDVTALLLREVVAGGGGGSGACHASAVRDLVVLAHHVPLTVEVSLWRACAPPRLARSGTAALLAQQLVAFAAGGTAAPAAMDSSSTDDSSSSEAEHSRRVQQQRRAAAAATTAPLLERRPVARDELRRELFALIQRRDDADADVPLLEAVVDAVHNMRRPMAAHESTVTSAMPVLRTRYTAHDGGRTHVLAFEGVDRVPYRFLAELCRAHAPRITDLWIEGATSAAANDAALCIALSAAHVAAQSTPCVLPPIAGGTALAPVPMATKRATGTATFRDAPY
jgi:hypothetical protein